MVKSAADKAEDAEEGDPRILSRFPFSLASLKPLSALALGILVSACGDGGPTDVGGDAFAITLSPSSLTLPAGTVASVAVILTRTSGYDGPIELRVENSPAGVVGSFTPGSLTGTAVGSTLTLFIPRGTSPRTAPLTIRATGVGVTDATAVLSLAITDDGTEQFALSVSPTTLDLQRGQRAQATVEITRVGQFTGNVSFTVTGAPAGVAAAVSPATTAGTSAILSVDVAANASTGDYTLTIIGSAAGVIDQATVLFLQVRNAPTGDLAT